MPERFDRRSFLTSATAVAATAALHTSLPGTTQAAHAAHPAASGSATDPTDPAHPGTTLPGDTYISHRPGPGRFPLTADGEAPPLLVHEDDHSGVVRVAGDLRDDLERVTGVRPRVRELTGPGPRAADAETVVLIGTLGRSPLIDALADQGRIDVSEVEGRWETSLQQVVEDPLPGVRQALVIAGSDPRGTIFGVYDVSRRIGVSPWYWWADVPARRSEALYVLPGRHTQGTPVVKYRGFFINDENPALGDWAPAYFGPGEAEGYPGGLTSAFYARVFEVLLRLKANYLWPAVWGRAFAEDDPDNHATARRYGIVMGTSHEAPMMRGIEEWNRHAVPAKRDENGEITEPGRDPYGGTGEWSFVRNRRAIEAYWADGIERMVREDFEGVVTLGMRGNGDVSLPDGDGIELMREIIASEREVLARVTGERPETVPQVWTLYKEVQRYWDKGLRPPEDVTVVVPDDNWGNLCKLPDPVRDARTGGFGLYYHFDYVGDGRNYKWVDTNPLPNIRDQLHQAHAYGVDRLWVVNAGDLKEMERPVQFFLDCAWDPARWEADRLEAWDRAFATENFGPRHAHTLAAILDGYTALQSRRKPELLNRRITVDPDKDLSTDESAVLYDDTASPFSLTSYREIERVTQEWRELGRRAERLGAVLPGADQDAYYQLVLYRVKAGANLYALREAQFTHLLYAEQGRAATRAYADRTRALFAADQALSDRYNNTVSGGKWRGFQSQPKIGYGDVERYGPDAGWQQPQTPDHVALPDALYPHLRDVPLPREAALGVSVDGSASSWPRDGAEQAVLPEFSPYQNRPAQYLEVFNRGTAPLTWRVTSAEPFVTATPDRGTLSGDGDGSQTRVLLRVDWRRVPKGTTRVPLTVTGGDGTRLDVTAVLQQPGLPRRRRKGFLEAGGYVSLPAVGHTRATSTDTARWRRVPGIGRTGDGMEPFPVTAPSQRPGAGPCLEYEVTLVTHGTVEVTAHLSPRNAALPGPDQRDGLRYAISFDGQRPQTVNITRATGSDPVILNRQWERNTSDNVNRTTTRHTLPSAGTHTLKLWMIDPTVVVQHLVIDTGGLQPSYLPPPPSLRRT
ncbi:glycosyl hydrolase 115 family protein [Streptomyces daliensis]